MNRSIFKSCLFALLLGASCASAQPELIAQSSPQPKAIPQNPTQPQSEVRVLLQQGVQAYQAGNIQDSFSLFSAAEQKARTLGDVPGEVEALEMEGFVLCASYKSNSLEWQRGIQKLKDAHKLAQNANLVDKELHILENLATAYLNAYKYPEAIQQFEQLKELSFKHKNFLAYATALNYLGNIRLQEKWLDVALKYFTEARKWARAAGASKEALEVETTALNNIGRVRLAQRQHDEAAAWFDVALSKAEEHRDWRNEAIARNNLAQYYQSMSLPRIALQELEEYVDLSPSGAAARLIANGDQDTLANTKNRLGRIYFDIGDPVNSSIQYHQSLKILEHMDFAEAEADAWNGIASIHLAKGDSTETKKALERALPFSLQVGGGSLLATYWVQSKLSLAKREFYAALTTFQKCQGLASSLGDDRAAAYSTAYIGSIEYLLNRIPLARRDLKLGLERFEAARVGDIQSVESKIRFLEDTTDFYRTYIHLLLQTGDTEAAFVWIEKIKARTLYDMMMQKNNRASSHVSQEQQQKERVVIKKLQTLNEIMDAEKMKSKPNPQTLERIRNQKEYANIELQLLGGTLLTQKLASKQKADAQTATTLTTARLVPADAAFIQYVTLRAPGGVDRVVMICITKEQGKTQTKAQGRIIVRAYNIQAQRVALEGLIQALRDSCESQLPYEAPASRLYQLLIAPAAKQLAGKRQLILCPEGILWQLPFQALLVNQGQIGKGKAQEKRNGSRFLIEQYRLSYALSASTLQAALQSRSAQKVKSTQSSLLAVVNPSSPAGELRDTETPLITLRQLVPSAKFLSGRAASQSNVQALAPRYRYIHFGSHGFFDDNYPMESYLQLASKTSPERSDSGRFTAQEIGELKLSADLVTLAACDSGRGQNRDGEGLVGITWALFLTGTPSQIVSQWKITSRSTAEFTTSFYRHLFQGEPKNQALQSAAVSMLRKKHRHPYHWAPFVLVGAWH